MTIKNLFMKNLITGIAYFLLLMSPSILVAQTESCKVLKKEIQGEYQGRCKNGLAHGKGVAKGIDMYEGKFKEGLPNGKGTYTFQDGSYYIGKFENGLQEGKGKYFYKVNGVDSVKAGVWENGNYIGEKAIDPYKVKLNRGVDRYNFYRLGDGNGANTNRVTIKFIQNGADNTQISDIRFQTDSGNRISFNRTEGFENIIFPFYCKLSYETPNKFKTMRHTVTFEFIINKPGDWELTLNN